MTALAGAQRGWITLQPAVHPDDEPPPRSLFDALFSGGGPPVPVCTWVARAVRQRERQGLQWTGGGAVIGSIKWIRYATKHPRIDAVLPAAAAATSFAATFTNDECRNTAAEQGQHQPQEGS